MTVWVPDSSQARLIGRGAVAWEACSSRSSRALVERTQPNGASTPGTGTSAMRAYQQAPKSEKARCDVVFSEASVAATLPSGGTRSSLGREAGALLASL